jgi:hypothetical protein
MTEQERSAIIGMWRSGASVEQIALITGWGFVAVWNVIDNYKRKILQDEKS